jgi:hypothetical protein
MGSERWIPVDDDDDDDIGVVDSPLIENAITGGSINN